MQSIMSTAIWLTTICGLLIAVGGAVVAVPRIYRAFMSISKFLLAVDTSTPILMKLVEDYRTSGPWIPASQDVSKLAHEAMRLAIHHGEVLERILMHLEKVARSVEDTAKLAAQKVEHVAEVAAQKVEKAAREVMNDQGQVLQDQNKVLAEIQQDLAEVKQRNGK
jgi:hypothetical protein